MSQKPPLVSNLDEAALEASDLPKGEVMESCVIPVPYIDILSTLDRFDAIEKWGCSIVQSAYIENGLPATEVGAERSVILCASDRVALKERLIAKSEGKKNSQFQYAVLPNDSSPFPCHVHNLVITLGVADVTMAGRQTYVSFEATFVCGNDGDLSLISRFLASHLFQPLLQSLTEYSLAKRYDMDPEKEDIFHAQHRVFESELLKLSVTPGVENVRDAYQSLFVSWIAIARQLRATEGIVTELQQNMEANEHVTEALREMLHGIVSAAHGDEGESNAEEEEPISPSPKALEAARAAAARTHNQNVEYVTEGKSHLANISSDAADPASEGISDSLARSALVSGAILTEEQLREAFDDLDEMKRGKLPKKVMRKCWEGTEHFGVKHKPSMFEDWLSHYTKPDRDYIIFEEFALLMLKLAQR